LGNIINY